MSVPLDKCYSLLELLDKLGKEGVTELIAKGKPRSITKGEMIYFPKSDINRILGEDVLNEPESLGIIVDDEVDTPTSLVSQLIFKQSIVKRQKIGQDYEEYTDKVLDMSTPVLYGRSQGETQDRQILKNCSIISALHGKLYMDEDNNLLYENFGSNKSKVRGPKEKEYTILEQEEIGVLMSADMLQDLVDADSDAPLTASIKLGYQQKPHYIVRIQVFSK